MRNATSSAPSPPRLEHEHHPEAIARRLAVQPRSSYLRDWLYGGMDGAVTTLAIAAGAAGGRFSPLVIMVLGLANVFADGFSMAASNFLGTRAEAEEYCRLQARERNHIQLDPAGETEEIRQIYQAKGFHGDDLERAVSILTANQEQWVATMLSEEYGLGSATRSPWLAAGSTMLAFVFCGLVPLLPFFLRFSHPDPFAAGCTLLVFFGLGAGKSRWSLQPWWRSGCETVLIGLLAAGTAFLLGRGLHGLLGKWI